MYFAVEDKAEREAEKREGESVRRMGNRLGLARNKGTRVAAVKNSAPSIVAGSPAEVADYTNRLLRETEESVIVRINPQLSNPRLFAQQGIFLCKLYHEASFGQMLMRMMMYPEATDPLYENWKSGAVSESNFSSSCAQ